MASHNGEETPLPAGDKGRSLYRTLGVTTRLLGLLPLGMVVFLAGFPLAFMGYGNCFPLLMKTGFTLCGLGLVAMSFNGLCDVAAAITIEGWVRAIILVLNGQMIIPGRYAMKHADNLASLFSRKPYLLWLFVTYWVTVAAFVLYLCLKL